MLVIAFAGCEKDDFTGHSQLVPTNPTITVDMGTIPTVIDGVKQAHKITLNMDAAQIVDVAVHVMVIDGTATQGVDFDVPSTVTIKAGRTSASFAVTFYGDVDFEETETFTIQIGDERVANATMTPVTQEFSIENFEDTDIAIEFSWMPEAYTQHGDAIDYTDIADMMLYIEKPDGSTDVVDGGAFEGYVISGDSIDGTYTIATAFYSAMQFPDAVDMNFGLAYNQPGVFTASQSYVGLANTATANCVVTIYMAEVEKAGTTYTLTENAYVVDSYVFDENDFVGVYGGADGFTGVGGDFWYNNPVTVAFPGDVTIDGLGHGWMLDFWGETVTTSTPVVMVMNTDGTLTIADQYCMTTDYDGSPYDYNIIGTGTWSGCNPAVLHIEYDLIQDGFSVGGWTFDPGGWNVVDYFTADLTMGANKSFATPSKNVKIDKPKR